jgi:Domain of unknown function (DUF397)
MVDLPQVAWRRSSHCDTNSCVDVAFLGDRVAVRDSKDENGSVLVFSLAAWTTFTERAKDGGVPSLPHTR